MLPPLDWPPLPDDTLLDEDVEVEVEPVEVAVEPVDVEVGVEVDELGVEFEVDPDEPVEVELVLTLPVLAVGECAACCTKTARPTAPAATTEAAVSRILEISPLLFMTATLLDRSGANPKASCTNPVHDDHLRNAQLDADRLRKLLCHDS